MHCIKLGHAIPREAMVGESYTVKHKAVKESERCLHFQWFLNVLRDYKNLL